MKMTKSFEKETICKLLNNAVNMPTDTVNYIMDDLSMDSFNNMLVFNNIMALEVYAKERDHLPLPLLMSLKIAIKFLASYCNTY